MKFLETDSLEQARGKLLQAADVLDLRTEILPLERCVGRILAQPFRTDINVPDFRRSTVDGYAVIAKDTQGAGESIPCFLEFIGEVHMGSPAVQRLASGQCAYVPTGGMLPEGADAMVMVEHAESFDDNTIAVYSAVSTGQNVIRIGEDAAAGEELLPRGRRLSARDIGVIASTGKAEAEVIVMPTVTILSTGDELVSPGQPKQQGGIYDINSYGLLAQCASWQIPVREKLVLRDHEAVLREAVRKAMKESDIVILSGGSSKGRADYTAQIIDELADPGVFTHGIRIKPGKPTILGVDEAGRTLLIGLPGHPAAAMMVFDLLVIWMLRTRLQVPEAKRLRARMGVNISGGEGRTVCQMVQLQDPETREHAPKETASSALAEDTPEDSYMDSLEDTPEDGLYIAQPLLGASGLIGLLSRADGYVMIDADKEGLNKGEIVDVIPL